MKKGLFIFAGLAVLAACGGKGLNNPAYEYIPFEQYKYTPADIEDGAEIELLSFSGGNANDDKTVCYYQYIAIKKATGDTIRIFSMVEPPDNTDKSRKAYFYKPGGILSAVDSVATGKKKYLVFNKSYAPLEKKNFKTAIGVISKTPISLK